MKAIQTNQMHPLSGRVSKDLDATITRFGMRLHLETKFIQDNSLEASPQIHQQKADMQLVIAGLQVMNQDASQKITQANEECKKHQENAKGSIRRADEVALKNADKVLKKAKDELKLVTTALKRADAKLRELSSSLITQEQGKNIAGIMGTNIGTMPRIPSRQNQQLQTHKLIDGPLPDPRPKQNPTASTGHWYPLEESPYPPTGSSI